MSAGGRGRTRQRLLGRMGLVAVAAVILALLFLISGHWILGVIFALAAVVAVWLVLQLRTVR